jgi:serine phosphatase RsbU (regulator of sigma subunit)
VNLRLRLIVVFFLLSVVPVGAVTYYTYASNAQAIRDAASSEAAQLAGELSQRMRTVTTQLSQRVETLMELPAAEARTASVDSRAAAAETRVAAAGSRAAATESEAVDKAMRAAEKAAEAAAAATTAPVLPAVPVPVAPPPAADVDLKLGDFAELIKNIEVRGLRPGRRLGGPPDARFAGRPDGAGFVPPVSPPSGTAAAGSAAVGAPPASGGSPAPPGGPASDRSRRFGPPAARGPGGPPPEAVDEPADPKKIRIDLRPVRRAMFEKLVADRAVFDALPLEEKQKVFAQIEQQMAGVAEGIEVLQKELASRAGAAAVDVRTQDVVNALTSPTAAGAPAVTAPAPPPPPTSSKTPALAPTPTPAPTSAPARAAARTRVTAPPAAPAAPKPPAAPAPVMKRSAALSGKRLAVRVERDGQIVGQVNADVDLPKLLATVFTTTSHDRGELPFAVGEGGELYTPTPSAKQQLEALKTSAISAGSPPGTTVLPEWILATTKDPSGSGLTFGIARPVGDALVDLQRTSARNAALGLGFIGLALIVIVPLSAGLTRNLDTLSDGVRRIAEGDYGARVPVRSKDEIGRLAVAFNKMAADVEEHQRAAVSQERIRHELELGRQIQHDMLPQAPLLLGLTEIKGVSVPAREVGGDFFNYFQLRDGRIALLVGDVSGKGVGAALLMANLQAALRTRLALGQDLASLAQELDVDIDRTTPGPVYATLFVGILDPASRRLRCVNAGHNPQYVLRTDGRLERMESTGRPIGLLSGGDYAEQAFDLSTGDVLFFYTDGCVEAENPTGDMFGSERLEAALATAAGQGADAVMAHVEAEVSRFRAGVELQDDATMMVVKVG